MKKRKFPVSLHDKRLIYRKPTDGRCKLKRHKGTFSLGNQQVMLRYKNRIITTKVYGIHINSKGMLQGHIRRRKPYQSVYQLGVAGWTT